MKKKNKEKLLNLLFSPLLALISFLIAGFLWLIRVNPVIEFTLQKLFLNLGIFLISLYIVFLILNWFLNINNN